MTFFKAWKNLGAHLFYKHQESNVKLFNKKRLAKHVQSISKYHTVPLVAVNY